jgi:hypothetical protein
MKTRLSLLLAALLMLSGCSIFQRSATWDTVVRSRSQYAGSGEGKDSYLNFLHQTLRNAGVPHKIVTYQFRFHNVYREESVDTASAILYSDDHTPGAPWWVMDEYHHVPVWLPNWELDAQLEFFIQRQVEVLSVKDYAGSAAPAPSVAKVSRGSSRAVVRTSKEKQFRSLFASGSKAGSGKLPAKKPAPRANSGPLPARTAAAKAGAPDARIASLFRTTHGTTFNPASSLDRTKMDDLRRRLLNRGQRLSLRD